MTNATVEFDDVQGLVRFGHGHLKAASFVLMRVTDRRAAGAWLATAPVTSAVASRPLPSTILQVALTSDGLRALGVGPDVVAQFSPEFVVGLGGDESRARRLGDVGANDPSGWRWGVGERHPDVAVLLYATPEEMAGFRASVLSDCAPGLDVLACLDTEDLGDIEPFGFADGVSQPQLDWERTRAAKDETRLAYDNRVCLGEFLLGYPNEYGGYSDRPLLDPALDPSRTLPAGEDEPGFADLGRNGSYLVMRQLRQDVRGFWRFLDREAGGDAELRTRWAAAMVGRRINGTPLVDRDGGTAVDPASGAIDRNAFDFRGDPDGLRCPLGAHVRRANPRNADLPADTNGLVQRLSRMLGLDAAARARDLVSSTRFHRLLRRGREYGATVSLDDALHGDASTEESGIHFLCLGANIARQFEFVQASWLMSAKFDGLHDERDPLVGHRQPGPDGASTDAFSLPRADGPSERVEGLPQFVTVVGGAYFFLPGLRALRYIAGSAQEVA